MTSYRSLVLYQRHRLIVYMTVLPLVWMFTGFVWNTYCSTAWTSLPAGFSILIHHLTVLVLWCSCPHPPLPERQMLTLSILIDEVPVETKFLSYQSSQTNHFTNTHTHIYIYLNNTRLAYWNTLSSSKNKKLARWPVWQCPPLDLGTGALASPLLFNNGGEILITILSELILCAITHEGRRRGKKHTTLVKPISNEVCCLPSAS